MKVLSDPIAEKAVLSGCYNGGIDIFYDIADIVQPSSFMEPANELLFACLKQAYEKMEVQQCDFASIQGAAKELGIHRLINKPENAQHIRQVLDFNILPANARKFAAKIRKLQIARLLYKQLGEAQEKITELDGTETITSILGIAENAVFDFSSLLEDRDEDPTPITQGLVEYLHDLKDNPVTQPGISTGFPRWDAAIGGGLRGGTVNLIGARSKGFKSGLALNMSRNIAFGGLPVLYLDTEMRMQDQQSRLVASTSKVMIRDIETGAFGKENSTAANVLQSAATLNEKCSSFYYKNISGFAFEEQLSVMRRWLFKYVGVDADRKANPCVICYDYLKLMDAEVLNKLAEHQALGFIMTMLHNFAVRYDVPILSFVQLNRDGIDKESASVVSQSDRIIWLCSNFSILKMKSDEEIAADGVQEGDFKIVPMLCRHGAGLPPGEYISCKSKRSAAYIEEAKTSIEIREDSDGN